MKKVFSTIVTLTLLVTFCLTGTALSAQADNNPLILSSGEAWINSDNNLRTGFIFQSDGTYVSINNYDGKVVGEYVIVRKGTWSVNKNNVTLTSGTSGATIMYTYKISGDTLTMSIFGSDEMYTKTNKINPSDNVYK